MKSIKFILFLAFVSVLAVSCKEDDDVNVPDVEVRDRGEQQLVDSDSLVNYLSSHYYNSGFFETGSNHKYTDIVITELQDGGVVPDGHTLLMQAVETYTSTFEETEYEYYILRLNQGGGEAPNFTDRVFVRYEGTSINTDETFDSVASPIVLPLQGNLISTSGAIKGWQLVMPNFNSATDFTIENGFVNYNNFGLGMMFIPSGLGYFSGTNTGVSFDNLAFKFELIRFEVEDHDGDGIPSYIEDLDSDMDVSNDDTDEDNFPNFIDLDDDGDGVGTVDELMSNTYTVDTNISEEEPILDPGEYEVSRSTSDGILTINTVKVVDSDNNGTPDYLQEDISINYNEEEEG